MDTTSIFIKINLWQEAVNSAPITTELLLLALLQLKPGITAEQLKELAVSSLYTNYFEASEALHLLRQQKLVNRYLPEENTCKEFDATGKPIACLELTEQGEAVLNTLSEQIPSPIQSFLKRLVQRQNYQEDIKATFEPDLKRGYQLYLQQAGNFGDIIRLQINVPNVELAQKYAKVWPKSVEEIYASILQILHNNAAELALNQQQILTEAGELSVKESIPTFDTSRQVDLNWKETDHE